MKNKPGDSINKSGFFEDTLKIVSGTTISAFLNAIATPIITRLFAPSVFGITSIYISITTIIGVVVCLRYEQSIILPEKDEEASTMLGVSLCFSLIISLLMIPIFIFGRFIIVNWLNAAPLEPFLFLIPIHIFFNGFFISLNYWNTRTKNFSRLAAAAVINNLVTILFTIILGFLGFTSTGFMIWAIVAGKVFSSLFLIFLVWREHKELFINSIRFNKMIEGIGRYKKFPIYGIGSTLLSTISWQLPTFLLSRFFTSTIVGYYALGLRIIKLPMSLIGDAISQVFFQRAVEAKNSNKLNVLVWDVFRRLVIIGLIPIFLLSIIGQDLFIFAFGQEWAEAGVYVQILSIWMFFWFISGPFSNIFGVLEKQEMQLYWNIANIITRFVSLWIGGILNDPRMALLLFSISGVIIYGWKVLINLKLSGVSIRSALKTIGIYSAIFIPFGIFFLFLDNMNINLIYKILIPTLFLAGYFIYVVLTDPFIFSTIRNIVPFRKNNG
ncbi:MAG: oligosaccharide flippase family protein [Candidatus Lokiarchaeota archaeon]|nr:oligosaccharide flippase family protein [Candidatus Lokiarchaeota archaeon]